MKKTIIGKDVIESLTLGMYDDPRIIFREYIQNAADQIDIALEDKILSSKNDGIIEIRINTEERSISIYDNGTGILANKVEAILKNIAHGVKDRIKHKGFRGIGRLGGLAYCDKLIFETSFQGEDVKSILTWDADKLRNIINNRETKEEATQVIDEITSYQFEKAKTDERYFKVCLINVSNASLLDKRNIVEYLSMVAPVSYQNGFIFKDHIYKKAKEYSYNIDEYPIYVNNEQIVKLYTTSIYHGENGNKRKIDEVYDIEFFDYKNKYDELLFWGWYSISNYSKQIPKINSARGIRLRKSNIQIGLDNTLAKLFKEHRGSFYFFGEVFAVSPELIPNSRRDYFIENRTATDFEKQLRCLFVELHRLYHFASSIRNEQKRKDKVKIYKKDFEDKAEHGFTDNKEREKYEKEFEIIKDDAKKAEKKLRKEKEKLEQKNSKAYKKIFDNIVGDNNSSINDILILNDDNSKTKFITDDISNFNKKERRLVSRIFSIIDIILTPDLANNLKFKIKEELKR